MRFSIIGYHFPDPEGSAAGRVLFATCTGLLHDGHDVEVCSWSPNPPATDLPPWAAWRPVAPDTGLAGHLRGLLRPRHDVLRAEWTWAPGSVAVADDPASFPAVAGAARSVVTFHYATSIDVAAVGRRSLSAWQDRRAEGNAARRAHAIIAYSGRVAGAVSSRAISVPIAYAVPEEAVPFVSEPTVALIAFWDWPPNRMALGRLLDAWPEVRDGVTGARLLIAGRGSASIGAIPGVENLGVAPRSIDVLSRAAVVAFPVPDTSGPKVKILEALSLGIPVVTTPAGVEGLALPDGAGAIVAPASRFAEALIGLLRDPARRAALGGSGRRAVLETHAPVPAARARVAALQSVFGEIDAG